MAKSKAQLAASVTSPELIDSFKATSSMVRDYSNLTPDKSGRPGLTFQDYYNFRPDEEVPNDWPGIFRKCNLMYRRVGLIWNVVNLMSDFTIKGLRIVHPNRKKERVAQKWFQKIGGICTSERFVNYLYRLGNVILQRYYGKIRNEDKLLTKGEALVEEDFKIEDDGKIPKGVIPWKYVFIDPATVVPVGGALASFVDKKKYGVKLSENIKRAITTPQTEEERALVAQLPADLIAAAKTDNGALGQYYVLKENRTIVYSYKKDDWDTWAYPLSYPIFDDVVMLNKLKLADMSALDGVSSKVRVWKLGDIANSIAPTVQASQKLGEMLAANVGGGCIDIIWGEDLELVETVSDSYNFLGEDKYKPCLNNIYSGLGVPPTLTATFGNSGTTNNYISLQTLIERLVYGRNLLIQFWENEIALFAKAMGWRQVPTLEFELPSLTDEQSRNTLLLSLADRNIISNELLATKLGYSPNMEKIRLNREDKEMKSKRRVRKIGPYADSADKLLQIFAQRGDVMPSQVGMELEAPKPEELATMKKIKKATEPPKPPAKPGQGRPVGKKDSTKRKTKTFKPKSKAMLRLWADAAQAKISELLHKPLLTQYGKANLRQLTEDEFAACERVKFIVLAALNPYESITEARVTEILKNGLFSPAHFNALEELKAEFKVGLGRDLTTEEVRTLQSAVYSELVELDA